MTNIIFEKGMKNLFIILSFISTGWMLNTSNAQQLPMYSQYMLNDFVLNPAIAGKNDYKMVQSNIRYQWVGLNDAPKTFVISANIPYRPKKVGLGGYIFTDNAGPITMSGINLAYSYHLEMGEELRMSMGLFGGMMQYRVNGKEIILADEGERYLFDGIKTAIVPDASFGTYLYTDRFFTGFSFNHLFHNQLKQDLFDASSESFGYLSSHLFVTGGYRFEVNSEWDVEPSILIKMVSPIPAQVDVSARLFYRKELWLGLQYRTEDAFSITVGYEYNEKLHIGYSYDFTFSNLKRYSSGSNEIMLGYKFGNTGSTNKKGGVPIID